MRIDRILINYAEIALKGRNRRQFEVALRGNIRHMLRRADIGWTVKRGHDRIIVDVPHAQADKLTTALEAIGKVAGVAWFAPAAFFHGARSGNADEVAAITACVLEQAAAVHRPGATFAVRVNRADKRYPIKSDDLARELGSAIVNETAWEDVDLGHPDQRFHLDIYPEGIYVYAQRHRGVGGLPVGSGGSVLGLLSAGIDSPVAAYLMAKRGCRVDFLHMTASQVATRQGADNLAARLAQRLSHYTVRSRLFMVPYTYFDLALAGQAQTGYEMILFRRFVSRIGEAVAARTGAQAMVSGDSLGQVASQTIENMVTSTQAVEMPVFRPLIGLDKQEIVSLARDIGTFELSIQPYKDCCALISQNPKTRSRPSTIERLEAELFPDLPGLIESTLADGLCLTFDGGRLVDERPLERADAPADAG